MFLNFSFNLLDEPWTHICSFRNCDGCYDAPLRQALVRTIINIGVNVYCDVAGSFSRGQSKDQSGNNSIINYYFSGRTKPKWNSLYTECYSSVIRYLSNLFKCIGCNGMYTRNR